MISTFFELCKYHRLLHSPKSCAPLIANMRPELRNPCLCVHGVLCAGGKKQHAGHHAPSNGPHAGDKKPKNMKGTGATKKGKSGG